MNFKKNGGFTLVELIVVIAILGILAGIGIPAYGKYVEKAQVAVEEQNINMFHNAFVVACVGNSEDPATYPISINWDSTGTIFMGLNEVTSFSLADEGSTVEGDFNAFFGFPTTTYEFKKLSSKVENGIRNGIDADDGTSSVTKNDDGTYTYSYTIDGKTYSAKVTEEQLAAMKNNTFADDIGAGALLGKVDAVANVAGLLLDPANAQAPNSVIEKLIFKNAAGEVDGGTEYLQKLASDLGMKMDTDFWALVADENGNAKSDVLANSLILTAAKETASDSFDTNFLQTVDIDTLKTNLDNPETATTAMAQLALTYGMYTSYCEYKGIPNNADAILAQNTFSGMADLLETVESDDFKAYLADETTGQKDLDAYMTSMEIVSKNSSDKEMATDILINGVNSKVMTGLLGDLMGNK